MEAQADDTFDALAGRAGVRQVLAGALAAAAAGSGGLVLVTGEPGMGKTTLARAVADEARHLGATVRWSACWAAGATVAHAPWVAMLGGLGAAASAAVDALVDGDVDALGASARAVAYARVLDALGDAAGAQPLVLVIDDLHWADEGTVNLLAAVAGSLPGLPVLVVGTYRDAELAADSPLLALGASVERVGLTGMQPAGVAVLLERLTGHDAAPAVVEAVHRQTGGNPFLVQQVGRLLAADPDAPVGAVVPAGVRDVLGSRLASLSGPDRDVLTAAAVLGSPFAVAHLAAVLAAPLDDVVAALGRAATARVVERVEAPGSWTFVHDLFRRAALDGVAAGREATLHRAAADALAAAGAEPAVVAAHLQQGATGPATEAAAWWVRAGERALAAMAWEEAAAHFQRAHDASSASDGAAQGAAAATVVAALLGLGRARLLLGDVAEAGRAFLAVAETARAAGDVDLLAEAALAFSSDLAGFEVLLFDRRQMDLLEEAATALEGADRDTLRARVLGRLSVALSWSASTERRLAIAEEALALARRAGDDQVLGGVLAAHCDAIAGPDFLEARLAESAEIVALAEQAGDGALELLGRRLRFLALLEDGQIGAAEAEAKAFGRRADALGSPIYSWYVPLWRGMFALAGGRVEQAEAAAAEVEAIGAQAGSTNAPMLAVVLRIQSMMEQHRAEEIFELLGHVGVLMQVGESAPPALGQFSYARLLAGRREDARAATDRLRATWDELYKDAEWLPCVALALRSAAMQAHPWLPELLAEVEPYADLLAVEGIGAGIHGAVAADCALARSALGDHDAAVAHGRRAVEVGRACGALVLARAQRVLADALVARAGAGDTAEAEALHAAADAAFHSFGIDVRVRAGPAPTEPPAPKPAAAGDDARFEREGDVWHVAYAGAATIVKHTKGMADLAVLLTAPGREVHVTELEGVTHEAVPGRGDDALDRKAIDAYRQRLADLADEIDDADAAHDRARAEKARVEYDALVDQLSSSLGLGGRARAAGPDPVERLRKAVSARVKEAIKRIDAVHPALARHLTVSVRTGVFCSYRPENPVDWRRQG